MARSGTSHMTTARKPSFSMRLRALVAALATLAVLAATAHAAPIHGTPLEDRLTGTPAPTTSAAAAATTCCRGAAAQTLQGGPATTRSLAWPEATRSPAARAPTRSPATVAPTGCRGSRDRHAFGRAGGRPPFRGAGRDLIRARNGGRDRVDCGAGRDTAILDARDLAVRCEVVRRPRPAKPASTTPQATAPFGARHGRRPTADCRPGHPAAPTPTRPRTPLPTRPSTHPSTRSASGRLSAAARRR